MPINNIQPVGDDQRWKREVEVELERLKREVAVLNAQFNARNK